MAGRRSDPGAVRGRRRRCMAGISRCWGVPAGGRRIRRAERERLIRAARRPPHPRPPAGGRETRLREPRAEAPTAAGGRNRPTGDDADVHDRIRRSRCVAGWPLPDAGGPLLDPDSVAGPPGSRRADARTDRPSGRRGPAGSVDDRRAVPGRQSSARRGRRGEVPRDGDRRRHRAPDPARGLVHVAARRWSMADRVVRRAEPRADDPRSQREGTQGRRLTRARVDRHLVHLGDRERRAAGRIPGGHTRRFSCTSSA